MNSPAISVVLPVFNCEKYIGQAIQSVLQQTFTDFEFIIINDGSNDNTEEVIKSFSDSRIIYEKNDSNKGLVYSLNKGVDKAVGKYIARMDGDDICMPERFRKQIDYLEQNGKVDVLATIVTLIDENDQVKGIWPADLKNINEKEIRRQLPKDNCIAHPTVIGKTSVFKKYKYNQTQSQLEDYDLWLRLLNDGIVIHKLAEPLLLHRILQSSFTRTSKKIVFGKMGGTEIRFGWHQIQKGRLGLFASKAFLFAGLNMVKVVLKQAKISAQHE